MYKTKYFHKPGPNYAHYTTLYTNHSKTSTIIRHSTAPANRYRKFSIGKLASETAFFPTHTKNDHPPKKQKSPWKSTVASTMADYWIYNHCWLFPAHAHAIINPRGNGRPKFNGGCMRFFFRRCGQFLPVLWRCICVHLWCTPTMYFIRFCTDRQTRLEKGLQVYQ